MSAIKEVYNLLWYSTSKKDRKLANRFYEEVSALEKRIKELEAHQQSMQEDEAFCVCENPLFDYDDDGEQCRYCGNPPNR